MLSFTINMLSFLVVLLCFLTVQGSMPLPEYDDPIHGPLIVSRINPPFLTLKAQPNVAFYLPTDQQFREIRHAVYSGRNRIKRSSIDSAKTRLTLSTEYWEGDHDVLRLSSHDFEEGINSVHRFKRNSDNSSSANLVKTRLARSTENWEEDRLSIEDFKAGEEAYKLYCKFIGKMLISSYSAYIGEEPSDEEPSDEKPIEPSELAFDERDEKTYVKALITSVSKVSQWIIRFRRTLELHAENRTFVPIDKVLSELEECPEVGASEVTDRDFKFKSEAGGVMTYYKVQCLRMNNKIFVLVALYDNKFTLKPELIQRVSERTEDVPNRTCLLILCWISSHSTVVHRNTQWFNKNRHLTGVEEQSLNRYFMEKVVQQINLDFYDKIREARKDAESLF